MTNTHKQTANLISHICRNLPILSGPEMQYWCENPKELQKALYDCLNRVNRVLDCSEPANVNDLFGEDCKIVRENDQRSKKLGKIATNKLIMKRCVKIEDDVKTEEAHERLKKEDKKMICLGLNVLQALWKDYQENRALSILEWLRKTNEIDRLYFHGTIVGTEMWPECIPILRWTEGQGWKCDFKPLHSFYYDSDKAVVIEA